MKITVKKPVELDVRKLKLEVDVMYDDEDMPYDFPFRVDDVWCVTIDLETGKIDNWPAGVEASICMKVSDCGNYYLLDEHGAELLSLEDDYVPSDCGIGGGDYIEMKILADGSIEDWPSDPDFCTFSVEDD